MHQKFDNTRKNIALHEATWLSCYDSSAFASCLISLINIFLVQIDINKDISKFEQVFISNKIML